MKKNLQTNKDDLLIADFMKHKKCRINHSWGSEPGREVTDIGKRSELELEFDSNWQWLMPVVERIGGMKVKLKGGINCTADIQLFSRESGIIIYYNGRAEFSYRITYKSKIGSVYWIVIDFIKWYNKQTLT